MVGEAEIRTKMGVLRDVAAEAVGGKRQLPPIRRSLAPEMGPNAEHEEKQTTSPDLGGMDP